MGEIWDFRCYVSPTGRDKIADWKAGLSAGQRNVMDNLVLNIWSKQRAWDARDDYRKLKGAVKHLHEFRWKCERVQLRLIVHTDGLLRRVEILMGCSHKGQVYEPNDALETAAKRFGQLRRGEATTQGYARGVVPRSG